MIKKLLALILLSFNISMFAGEEASLLQQELFYDAGISFAHQQTVADWQTLKDATIGVYNNVEEIQQLIDIVLMMDEDLVEKNIVSFDQLLDMFDKEISDEIQYADFKQDLITLVATYQNIFSVFIKTCPEEPSFIIFSNYLENHFESHHSSNDELSQALNNFAYAFENFENRLDELF